MEVGRCLGLLSALILSGCSATKVLANALSGSGGVYATDDDPELIRDAVPFGLKTMEGVLVEQPEHEGLLLALASGFTQYAYAFVQQDADEMAEVDIDRSLELQRRAKKLYLRARGYALRGLAVRHPDLERRLHSDADALMAEMKEEDVPLLYWSAASWALAISGSKDQPEMLADFPLVGKLAGRALELDETWGDGAIHEFFISYEAASPTGSAARAREHFQRAIAISDDAKASPYVALAEGVAVKEQNAKEFNALIDKALAVDVDAHPQYRLANVVIQRRARRLKKAAPDLFFEPEG